MTARAGDWPALARTLAGGVVTMLLAPPCSNAGEGSAGESSATPSGRASVQVPAQRSVNPRYAHLGPDDRLGNLLDHPAFQGFGRRLLPWDGRDYDLAMPLRELQRLLPYHSHVEPRVVVAAINRMVDDISDGHTVFHELHSDQERQATPALAHTGLFFFRGKPGAPFAVIAPGGGFAYVGAVHEGFPHAQEISRRGFNAFVLKYRAGHGARAATEDLASALAYIHRNAAWLEVDTAGFSLWGSSAGARMAASIGSRGTVPYGGPLLPRPAVVVMAYTAHSDVDTVEPPTFVIAGDRDAIAPPAAMEARIAALRRIGTPVEYHRYPDVGHGFGTGHGTPAQGWIGEAVRFWEQSIRKAP